MTTFYGLKGGRFKKRRVPVTATPESADFSHIYVQSPGFELARRRIDGVWVQVDRPEILAGWGSSRLANAALKLWCIQEGQPPIWDEFRSAVQGNKQSKRDKASYIRGARK